MVAANTDTEAVHYPLRTAAFAYRLVPCTAGVRVETPDGAAIGIRFAKSHARVIDGRIERVRERMRDSFPNAHEEHYRPGQRKQAEAAVVTALPQTRLPGAPARERYGYSDPMSEVSERVKAMPHFGTFKYNPNGGGFVLTAKGIANRERAAAMRKRGEA